MFSKASPFLLNTSQSAEHRPLGVPGCASPPKGEHTQVRVPWGAAEPGVLRRENLWLSITCVEGLLFPGTAPLLPLACRQNRAHALYGKV